MKAFNSIAQEIAIVSIELFNFFCCFVEEVPKKRTEKAGRFFSLFCPKTGRKPSAGKIIPGAFLFLRIFENFPGLIHEKGEIIPGFSRKMPGDILDFFIFPW